METCSWSKRTIPGFSCKSTGFMVSYADMEPHVGSEQGGKRPVVVLQNNIGNRHSPTLIVATVTTRTEKKKKQPTHVLVDPNPAFEEPSMILLEQILRSINPA